MNGKAQLPVKIQQCLFGYEDGHRLLASSLQLPTDAESLLLRLSDLAPGVNDFNAESYWTGVPLISIKYYALLRTWSAPEMSRPGCVWTHALLVGFDDIARFVDLAILEKYSVRPTQKSQHDEYSQPLLIDVTKAESTKSVYDSQLSYNNLLKVIRAVYISDEQPYLLADENEFDASVFRVWSQQWPRLRRSFSFRTAGSLSESSTAGVQFDLRVSARSDNYTINEEQQLPLEPKSWVAATIKDALSPEPTDFRRFLWRYGSDIHNGRERFNFLADLYVSIHKDSSGKKSNENILLRVAEMLPEPENGKALKSDLIEGRRNTYSLIPAIDPLDCLTFLIQHPQVTGLLLPTDSTFPYLRELWSTRSEEILALAEQAVNMSSILRKSILAQLVELIGEDSFLTATNKWPNLRHSLISEKPSLLNNDGLLNVGQPGLSKLLSLLPDDQQLADRVIGRLVYLNDQSVAEEMFARFPNIVTRRVVEAIEIISSKSDEGLPRVWLKTITKSVPDFFRGGYIENSHSLSALAVFAEVLGYRNSDVLKAGPLPWASALIKAKNDIYDKRRDKLDAFLLMIAIEKPLHGCEPIFERTFEPIHSALASEKLAHDAQRLIAGSLPNLYWWKQWDMCHRLRLAVVNAYVNNKLDQESFNRLANDQKLANSLVNLARETKAERSFLKNKQRK